MLVRLFDATSFGSEIWFSSGSAVVREARMSVFMLAMA
jgi:hypothetical protein